MQIEESFLSKNNTHQSNQFVDSVNRDKDIYLHDHLLVISSATIMTLLTPLHYIYIELSKYRTTQENTHTHTHPTATDSYSGYVRTESVSVSLD